jgi:ferredoxin-type protein NapG
MDRRDFFRRGFGQAAEVVVKAVDKRVDERAKHWIRPPYALPELDFLLACTRCNACIEACPHHVIFPLAARLGADVVNTPALDLLKKGCHLCEDWPCVSACEANALVIVAIDSADSKYKAEPAPMQKLANAEIDESSCLPFSGPECGACISVCPAEGALVLVNEKPVIHQVLCVGCGLCREACIVEDKAINIISY